MRHFILSFLLEFIFVVILWAMLIVIAILWPVMFLYLRFISSVPVSDQISGCAENIIKLNNFLDALMRRNKEGE